MYKLTKLGNVFLGANFKFRGIENLPGYELNAVQLIDWSTVCCNVKFALGFAPYDRRVPVYTLTILVCVRMYVRMCVCVHVCVCMCECVLCTHSKYIYIYIIYALFFYIWRCNCSFMYESRSILDPVFRGKRRGDELVISKLWVCWNIF